MQPLVCTASEARCRPFLHDLRRKKAIFAAVNDRPIDIHTHRPTAAQTIRCVGIHPWQAAATDALPATFEEAAAAADAVGEIGLDFARREVDPARQLRLFRAQLDTAERLGKPVMLHVVRAFEEAMRELRGRRLAGVILHGFVGSKEQAARAVAAGSLALKRYRPPSRTSTSSQGPVRGSMQQVIRPQPSALNWPVQALSSRLSSMGMLSRACFWAS